ncbi:MAG: S8 family serine peptidase [Patescibacteria group bacterium]
MKRRLRTISILTFTIYHLLSTSTAFAKTPSDYLIAEQWYLNTIDAYDAWDTTVGSNDVIVAVLDTGIDLEHPDLKVNLWINEDEVADGEDNDNNGYEDDLFGWDFVDGDIDPSPTISDDPDEDAISHGTVVAGVIGAVGNNGLGVAGLNWQVKLMPLRVLDESGNGNSHSVSQAIEYAVENGADVINLSFVTETYDKKLADMVAWAIDEGVVVVSAVGNTGENGALLSANAPSYPACFDIHYGMNRVIAVAATDKDDGRAYFSNYGAPCTDISAPGVDVFGTVFHSDSLPSFVSLYGGPWQGTSLAAPMVSGAVALLRAAYPALTPEQVRLALQLSVDPLKEPDAEIKLELGSGRLNIARALEVGSAYASAGTGASRQISRYSSNSFVVAQGVGDSPLVRRFNSRGDLLSSFNAYDDEFRGGVRLAMGDVTGDGVEEIVTAAGPGGGPQIRIFDIEGRVYSQFFAFNKSGRIGISVATADLDADGIEEIIVTQDKGGNGQVRLFDAQGILLGAFYPLQRTAQSIMVTSGNMDNDEADELLFWSPTADDGRVLVYDGTGSYVRELRILGTSVDVGDIDGDGTNEIISGTATGTSPVVYVYANTGTLLRSFSPFGAGFNGGVLVSVGDIDESGQSEIYVTPAINGGPQVQMWSGSGLLLGSFFAFASGGRSGATSAIW